METNDTIGVVLSQQNNGVLTLTINRPDRRNALSDEVVGALKAAVESARVDPTVRVIVITGSGDRAFCAGGDLSPGSGGLLQRHDQRGGFVELLQALWRVGKPTVARVNGHALGGGFGLVLACDLAVATDSAVLGTPEIDVGLFPMMIMALIHRSLPPKRTLEMMLMGRRIGAAQAYDWGLVNAVVPASELDTQVAEITTRLCSVSPAILRLGLESYHTMADMHQDEALRFLQSQLTINTLCDDAAEGVGAFLAKRPPEWKGR
ncbi:MAG: enoyl-CoA hydratase/isomerase family protein [Myxococcales bacterium]|nr:enoyl-CoA hydratase/isomerase family protein [Myxococcales bacterium]